MSHVKHAHTYLVGTALALGAAMFGAALAASPAAASSSMQGYSCYGTDSCHEGDRSCCTNNAGGSGHCSTSCPIIVT